MGGIAAVFSKRYRYQILGNGWSRCRFFQKIPVSGIGEWVESLPFFPKDTGIRDWGMGGITAVFPNDTGIRDWGMGGVAAVFSKRYRYQGLGDGRNHCRFSKRYRYQAYKS